MTERRDMDQFETRFAERVRAYTDPATERRIDALAISRAAMSSRRASGWLQRRLGGGLLDRRIAGLRWAAALVAVAVIGVVGVAVVGRPSDSVGPDPTRSPAPLASGPVPDVLRHSWQRPYAVTPELDQWGSGFLSLTTGLMDFGPEPGDAASRSAIAAAGADTLVTTATSETQGCAIGDMGAYRWSVEGKGTVLTLTAIRADACAAREQALAGPWVRSDLPLPPSGVTMLPGTYSTSSFDLFGEPGVSGQLSYTVPEGWKVKEDRPETFLLHHLPDASSSQPSTDSFIHLFAQPGMAAEYAEGAACGTSSDAPGVGRGVDDIVGAIMARPGVVSTRVAVTIGGYEGQMLDIHLAPSWTRGCVAPEGPIVAIPILREAGSETSHALGIGPHDAFRLILLDLTDGRTMSIAIFNTEQFQPSVFEEQVAEVMPVVESFELHPPTP